MAFEAGQRVGDYEVVRVLGTGGLGEVYEVRHAISQRAEAMKVLLPDQRAAAEMGERFRREIQMLGALSHPHIASLHNAFYHDGQLIMVMELVSGETLRAKSTRTLLSVPRCCNMPGRFSPRSSMPSAGRSASRHEADEHHDHYRG